MGYARTNQEIGLQQRVAKETVCAVFCRYILIITDGMQHYGGMKASHQTILDLAAQRGLYARPYRSTSEHGTLAEVARKHPQAIVCLLSALRVHDLTTQSPFQTRRARRRWITRRCASCAFQVLR